MSDLGSHRWALVVAHPGHELRAFHFVECARPLVAVLTDGSGADGVSRLDETARLLDEAGARRNQVYGSFTDREAYACLMAGDCSRFLETARQLSQSFDAHGITAVLTDAAEGYNPVHDVCRSIAEAAVRLCGPRAPLLFELDLVGPPDGNGPGLRLRLDDGAFTRKLDAARRYAALTAETGAAFKQHGVDAFRTEFLRRAVVTALPPPDYTPYYEQVGLERVRQGRYPSALRYRDHVRPVLTLLLVAAGAAEAHALPLNPLH
jgi:hypothetical protein